MEELRATVLRSARELLGYGLKGGVLDLRFRIDAEDEGGKLVHSLPFEGAISIIFPDGSGMEKIV